MNKLRLMNSCFFLLHLLFPCFCFANTLVFIHLGSNIHPCIFTTLEQTRYLNQDSEIYLLTDHDAYNSFTTDYLPKLDTNHIQLINMDLTPFTSQHIAFRKTNKIDLNLLNGFWNYALERFFYLFDFIKHKNLKNIIHLESDSMLYIDVGEILPIFEKLGTRLASPFQSMVGCIPCFVFIKNAESLAPLIDHILSEMNAYTGPRAHIDVNDMQTLASFYCKFGNSYMTPLPILMPEFSLHYPKKTSNFEPDNTTPLEFLSLNSSLFEGYIFDAATLGVFANGNDRRYFPNNGPGIVHYRSLFDPGYFSFYWGKDSLNRSVPYLDFKERSYRIVNLHFHSKMPEGFTSYTTEPTPFFTESHE